MRTKGLRGTYQDRDSVSFATQAPCTSQQQADAQYVLTGLMDG